MAGSDTRRMRKDDGPAPMGVCAHHMELDRQVVSTATKVEALEKETDRQRVLIEALTANQAKLQGSYDGTIPQMQVDQKRAFELIGEQNDTAEIYHGQVRNITGRVEIAEKAIEGKASNMTVASHEKALEGKASKEEVKNCYTWIRYGFVAVAIVGLLWVAAILAKVVGVPGP